MTNLELIYNKWKRIEKDYQEQQQFYNRTAYLKHLLGWKSEKENAAMWIKTYARKDLATDNESVKKYNKLVEILEYACIQLSKLNEDTEEIADLYDFVWNKEILDNTMIFDLSNYQVFKQNNSCTSMQAFVAGLLSNAVVQSGNSISQYFICNEDKHYCKFSSQQNVISWLEEHGSYTVYSFYGRVYAYIMRSICKGGFIQYPWVFVDVILCELEKDGGVLLGNLHATTEDCACADFKGDFVTLKHEIRSADFPMLFVEFSTLIGKQKVVCL